jgi:hypothetical protein
MPLLIAQLSAHRLLEVVAVSLVAGVAITTLFALVVRWGARATEAHHAGHAGGRVAYGALTAVTFVAFAAAVVYGVQVMLSSK